MRFFKLVAYFWQIITSRMSKKSIPEIIFNAVSDFGGVYIKLIQFVCLRTNILTEKDKLRFLSFYDNVPIEPMPIRQILTSELGNVKLSQFHSIDPEPFASGTFGQVYKAQLRNGVDIVIKIKRPNLVKKLKYDFGLLKIFTRIFNFLVEQKMIDLRATLSEFERSTFQELDYLQEAQNADYFYKTMRNHPRIYIPKTYLDLCTKNILVQEYVGGIAVTDLIRFNTKHPGVYRSWLLNNYQTDPLLLFPYIAYDIGVQGLLQGIFYADPHPGNIKILPQNRYAYIDFGIVGNSPENRLLYYEVLAAFSKKAAQMDMEKIGKSFLEWGAAKFLQQVHTFDEYFADEKNSLTKLVFDKYKTVLETKRDKFRQFDEEENFVQVCFDIIESGTILNVKVPEKFLTALKTMIVFKSWVSYLEPEFHFMRRTYKKILQDINPSRLQSKKEDFLTNPEISLEFILDWAENLAESDLPFQRKIDKQLMPNIYV